MCSRILTLFGVSLLVVACVQRTSAPDNVPDVTPTLPDPHHHVVDVNNNWLGQVNAAGFKIVEVSVKPGPKRENVTGNQDKTFQAFFTCDQTCRMFFEELAVGHIYELQAPSFSPGRPFSDLVWVTNEILVFDQWAQPHHGVHYAVDVKEKKLILASPFPDQLP